MHMLALEQSSIITSSYSVHNLLKIFSSRDSEHGQQTLWDALEVDVLVERIAHHNMSKQEAAKH